MSPGRERQTRGSTATRRRSAQAPANRAKRSAPSGGIRAKRNAKAKPSGKSGTRRTGTRRPSVVPASRTVTARSGGSRVSMVDRGVARIRPATDRPRSRRPRRPANKHAVFWIIVIATAVLVVLGLAMVFSASTALAVRENLGTWTFLSRQLIGLVIGLFGAIFCYRSDPRLIRKLIPFGLGVTGIGLVAVLFFGKANGSRRWIETGIVNVQPSEVAKLVLILWAANLLTTRQRRATDPGQNILPVAAMGLIVSALLLAEPDLSTALLICMVLGVLLVVGGARLDVLSVGALSLLPLLYFVSTAGYRADRIVSLNPWSDPDEAGYQTVQSMLGIATGGWFGVGAGASRSKWGFLPEAHTDAIFSVLGEEFGIVGCLTVLTLFALIVGGGLFVAARAANTFDRLMAAGISAWIGFQALINIGVAVGRLPNTGMTLPFVSYGATSMVVTVTAMGLLLGAARRVR